jgi:hypothetical protein
LARGLTRGENDLALLKCAEKLERAERAGLCSSARKAAHKADRGQLSFAGRGAQRPAIHLQLAVGTLDDGLRFERSGGDVKTSLQDQ